MAEILIEQGAIDGGTSASCWKHSASSGIKKYAGDAEKSLAAIGVGPSTRQKLAELVDADLDSESLASVGVTSSEEHSDTTVSYAVGTSPRRRPAVPGAPAPRHGAAWATSSSPSTRS